MARKRRGIPLNLLHTLNPLNPLHNNMSTTALQEYSDPTVVANLMNEQRFNRMMIIAQTMASAALIPEHLLGRKKGGVLQYFTADEIRANCFLIVNQAFRWGMDPFAVMPETYVVGGKLAYQGKLIAGLVNSLANLEERLSYEFTGTKGKDDFTVTVSGKFKGAPAPVTVQVSVGQAKTDNQMWIKDPEQKLVYTGATKWARRWCPEIILGIMTDDDADQMEMRDVTPRNTEPVKVITGGTGKASKEKPEPQKAAATVETTPAEIFPSREEMTKAIKSRMKELKIGLPLAETKFRAANLLKAGQTFVGTTDAELFAISTNLDILDPLQEATVEPSVIHAFYQNHAVSRSAEGAERKWTCWKLRYQVAGEDDICEAVTFSSTLGAQLDMLEGAEAILLTVESGEKGNTLKSLELAPTVGGAA